MRVPRADEDDFAIRESFLHFAGPFAASGVVGEVGRWGDGVLAILLLISPRPRHPNGVTRLTQSLSYPRTDRGRSDPLHYCFFDIDGTLLSSGGAGQAAMEAAYLEIFGVGHPVEGISFAGRTDHAITTDLCEYYGVSFENGARERFVECYLGHLPRALATRDGRVLPGILELLEILESRDDVVLGLLTGNFRRGAEAKLKHFDLHDRFHFGGFGDHHLDRDDVARDAHGEATDHHGDEIPTDRLWVLGDTPADVKCGRAIGANVIAVATGGSTRDELEPSEPDHLFDDFSEFEKVAGLIG